MAKVSIIGAGNVGATCCNSLVHLNFLSELVLLDVKEGVAEGKVMDMMQTSKLHLFNTRIQGVTNDYKATEGSDVVIITSGIPRKPGMTREELIGTNANITLSVIDNILKYSPDAVIIMVTNPMDTTTYLACKKSGIPKNRVIGMGGVLDSSRFNYYLSQALNVPMQDVEGMVIGGHGDTTMIPLIKRATYCGIKVTDLLSEQEQQEVINATMVGGATLTKLLGTSAWYAPGAAAAIVAKSIILDEKRLLPSSIYLDGEYGQKDICIGVPVVIGKNGWEKIVDLELMADEQELFDKSASAIRATNDVLKEMNLI